jgi:N-acetylmuramoyl-L-alanine amidase
VTSVINSKTNDHRPPLPVAITSSQTHNPQRVYSPASSKLEARPRTGSLVSTSSATLNHGAGVAIAAKRDSSGDRSLVRVFGLKLGKVVIDAGHGGHDTGTIGPHGLMEKDLVFDVALRLGKLISQQLGAEVVYTRSDDVFIPLEDRTKIANDEKADLFISIHANSSPEPSATGIETYYFNLTADKTALDLATRENATSVSSISDLNDLLHKAVLKTKSDESREFAQRVQASLWGTSVRMNNRSRDRGVRQAPFVVLIGATMPSILAEIGFVSNPHDEKLFNRTDQRAKIAEALFKGISQYANSLSHVQIARAVSQ